MLIGIHGKAGAGKDEFAKFICSEALLKGFSPFQRYGFADPIKEACNLLFGWDERHAFGNLKEVVDPYFEFSPRKAYQTLGTQWGRNCLREDLWLLIGARFFARNQNVIVPDVRFDNEAEFILRDGGTVIHIVRPQQENISLASHASEAGLSEAVLDRCVTIYNDSSLEHLRVKARIVLDGLQKQKIAVE